MTTVFTVGHGNRSLDEFVTLLRQARIECLVDVRAYPASRRHPQFARDALEHALAAAAIHYRWEGPAMGGRRRPVAGSPHTALRNAGFRGYADHMTGPEFRTALDRLIGLGGETRVAIMCAERLPWRCHRYLISDTLAVRGVEVVHIVSRDHTQVHAPSRLARNVGGVLIYDVGGTQAELGL